MRDENCKRAAAATRHSVSLRQSPAVPFAFPMLRCTAPKEWTLHCTATTSPPWPLCCLLYCSVLACLRRDYPCGREERKESRWCSATFYLPCYFCQNRIFNCPRSQSKDLSSASEHWRDLTPHYFSSPFRQICVDSQPVSSLSRADTASAIFRWYLLGPTECLNRGLYVAKALLLLIQNQTPHKS